jgi:hypothetical protein
METNDGINEGTFEIVVCGENSEKGHSSRKSIQSIFQKHLITAI